MAKPALSASRPPGEEETLLVIPIGPLDQWTFVRGASRLAEQSPHTKRRIMLSRVSDPDTNLTARRWLGLQRPFQSPYLSSAGTGDQRLVPPIHPAVQTAGLGQEPVFWRLAVGRLTIGLGATAFSDADEAAERAEETRARADRLTICHAFSDGATQPLWAALDDGVPVLIGAPASRVVVTFRPTLSIGAALRAAEVETYVHETGRPDVPEDRDSPQDD